LGRRAKSWPSISGTIRVFSSWMLLRWRCLSRRRSPCWARPWRDSASRGGAKRH